MKRAGDTVGFEARMAVKARSQVPDPRADRTARHRH